MKLLPKRRPLLVAIVLIFLIMGVVGIFVFMRANPVLPEVLESKNIRVSAISWTTGTNHTFYYGNPIEKFKEPLLKYITIPLLFRMMGGTANGRTLNFKCRNRSTVVWVVLEHPDFRTLQGFPDDEVQSPRFGAFLLATNRLPLELKQTLSFAQEFNKQKCVLSWVLPGEMDAHEGRTIRIESATLTESVTLRVP